jgi:hypothetical protein
MSRALRFSLLHLNFSTARQPSAARPANSGCWTAPPPHPGASQALGSVLTSPRFSAAEPGENTRRPRAQPMPLARDSCTGRQSNLRSKVVASVDCGLHAFWHRDTGANTGTKHHRLVPIKINPNRA